MGMIVHGLGLNTTVELRRSVQYLAYWRTKLRCPDGWELAGYFREAFAEYQQLLEQKKPAGG